MIAQFYIIPDSFKENCALSRNEIERKIKALAEDFVTIKKFKDDNKIFVHSDVYLIPFVANVTVSELMFNTELAKQYFDRDVALALRKVIVESKETDISLQNVIEVLLPSHDENSCYGLIGFNSIETISSEYQIVYNINDWYNFRRYFLSMYPKNDGDYFIDECTKYFPNLYFHQRNKREVEAILTDCARKIIYHLTKLNDLFKNYYESSQDIQTVLKTFSIVAKLDEYASLEGNASHKLRFTFDFCNIYGRMEMVCCEAHLKLCKNDRDDSSYSNDRRIYFHPGKNNIQYGKILIGHIGHHL
jgi:hypothetical protein